MGEVFISYKSEDRARVQPLVAALTAAGLAVWWDVQIEGGAAWRQTIAARLDTAACVVVVWSRLSVGPAAHFVQDEATRAYRRGVYLPVAIDAVEAPLGFGQHQVIGLTGWTGNAADPRIDAVIAAVRALVGGGERPAAPPTAAAPRRGWRWPILAAAGAAVSIAVAMLIVRPADLLCWVMQTCAATAPRNSIAVLPFANLSGDPGQEYFSDGLSEELQGALSRTGAMQVAARTSSFKFKNSKDVSSTIGARLGVAYLLDGSVRRDRGAVRVSTQLVEAATGFERWSQTYDRQYSDIFAVQSSIAEAVAAALKVRLLGRDVAALSRGGTLSPAAYDAYLRGRRLFDANADAAGYREALAKFDAAIAADAGFAVAHAARARTLLAIANSFTDDPAAQRAAAAAALTAAQRAVALAPQLAEAQATLAGALVNSTFDVAAARDAFARALATGGGEADILVRYGLFNCRIGNIAPGLAAVERSVVLDPLNPRVYKSLGLALITARRFADAVAALHHALALSPASNGVHAAIGDALLLTGQLPAAAAEYALEPQNWDRLRGLAIVRQRLGDTAGARAALAALIADSGDTGAYQQAQVYAQWGDQAQAEAALERAFRARDAGLLWLPSDPLLDPLHRAPGFARALQRLGLSAPATTRG